jgi:phosphatidylglycerol lysyltransferase
MSRVGSGYLNGSSRAGLRYALKRGERDGLEFEMILPDSLDTVIDELRDISNAWLARQQVGEKAFSVAAFTRDFVFAQPVALLRQHGRPIAFATVMTTDTKQEVTVGLMRYRPGEASRYAMEYLFVRLIEWARDHGYGSFNLGIAPLSRLGGHRLAPRWHRLGRLIWRMGTASTIFRACAPSRTNSIRSGSYGIWLLRDFWHPTRHSSTSPP